MCIARVHGMCAWQVSACACACHVHVMFMFMFMCMFMFMSCSCFMFHGSCFMSMSMSMSMSMLCTWHVYSHVKITTPAHMGVLFPLTERQQPAAVDKHGRDPHAPCLHALRVRQGVGVRESNVLHAVARVAHQRHNVSQVGLSPKLHVMRRDEHERRPDEGERRT